MKKIIYFLSCVVPFAVNAEGIYAGLGFGKTTSDSGITNVSSGGTLDETDNSTKLTIGYELDDTYSVEVFTLMVSKIGYLEILILHGIMLMDQQIAWMSPIQLLMRKMLWVLH